jgi:hypothetical protein
MQPASFHFSGFAKESNRLTSEDFGTAFFLLAPLSFVDLNRICPFWKLARTKQRRALGETVVLVELQWIYFAEHSKDLGLMSELYRKAQELNNFTGGRLMNL